MSILAAIVTSWLTLSGVAHAAPAGFHVTKTTDKCTMYLGTALPNGVVPMRAECRFPTVDLAKLDAAFSRWNDHDVPFSTVLASDVVRTEGGAVWVHQVHSVKGIADREGILKMKRTPMVGGSRFEWTLDNAGLTPEKGRVAIEFDDGFWEFTAHPEGGVSAVHQLAYDPGGSVPGFLVRWFQTAGLAAVLDELEAWALKL